MSTKASAKNENNPLTMSNEQILEQIYSTHVHSDTHFDVDSLFILADNTLKRSTQIVDHVVQGSQLASVEHGEDKTPSAKFSSPLCTLKQISSEMSCKAPGVEIAHNTTVAILNKLSSYDWEAKAVLTLAAFALEYGEFWLLSQQPATDPLAKSVSALKRVPMLTRPAEVQKHRQVIIELNNLVRITLEVVKLINELENITGDPKDVPDLEPAIEQVPVHVYWVIITIASIVTQIDILVTQSEHKQELSLYGQKVNIILSKLRTQITLLRQQTEEAEYIIKIRKLFQTPTEIVEVFKYLIFTKDAPQKLYDGATKTTVDVSVIKKKNVYLLISTLDITEEEISVIRPVYESIKSSHDEYKIVWVPIVEEWSEQNRKKLEILRTKMGWYVVSHYGRIAGYKYIKEEWGFKKKPMVVVLSLQGKVQHQNAFHLIQAYGMKAFPFTASVQIKINDGNGTDWLTPVVGTPSTPVINQALKQDKYIFFYGGKDKEWIQEFTKHVTTLTNDPIIKDKYPIELFNIEREDKSFQNRFWSGIESVFVTKVDKTTDVATQQVQKILSYKNETGWAILSKGSSVVVSGHGTTILKTVAEFDKWKDIVSKKGFEFSFKEYHETIVKTTHICSHFEIPIVAGKLPETIKCPDCPNTMEIYISYKCCHNGNITINATH